MSGARGAAPADADDPARIAKRNYRLGVANGALYQSGEGFMDAGTVIPVFLSGLTSSSALIGLATALGDIGWLSPQFLLTPYVTKQRRVLPLYRRAAVVRGAALVAFAALIWVLRDRPGALLAAFFACYGVYCFGAGVGALPFMEVVGRTVPRRKLGAYFSARLFWGGTLTALVGLVVREILKLPDFALRFGLLFALAAVIVSVAYALFGSIQEPDLPPAPSAEHPLAVLREGVRLLREDRGFRRLFASRTTMASWLTVSPFMVLLATRDLGGGARAAGTFLLARMAGFVLANLVWTRLSAKRGNGAVMRVATFTGACVAILASLVALFAHGAEAFGFATSALPPSAAIPLLEGIAFFGGVAHSGMLVAYGSLVIELAPVNRRQTFVSLMNTFLGVATLLPLAGGALVDAFGPAVVFALCGGLSLVGFRAALRLPAVRGIEPETLKEEGARG